MSEYEEMIPCDVRAGSGRSLHTPVKPGEKILDS